MFAGSRFCARCGAEAVRETIDEQVTLHCPRCRSDLQALRLGATTARECGACGGLWLDPDSLQRLVTARDENAGVVGMLSSRAASATATPDVVRYIPCPSCAKLMNRVNFARASGVILDICKTHGVWLDRGELQGVLQFVANGGLATAREREHEHLLEEQRRLAAMMAHADRPFASDGLSIHGDMADLDPAPTGAVERLLQDALGMLFSR